MAVLKAKDVETKLRECHGNMAAVGRAFGVTRQAVFTFVRARPKLAKVLVDCREAMKDNVESALYKAALSGEGWAVCFYLKTQAKDRGYIEKQEIESTGGVRILLTEEIVDAPGSATDDKAS